MGNQNTLSNVMNELLDVEDDKERAMRLADFVVTRDKYLSEIGTEYRIESFKEQVSGGKRKEKTRITIEF